ncbi:hypothetical protein ACOSQ2_010380 [Xanthoceras sorbifolium]
MATSCHAIRVKVELPFIGIKALVSTWHHISPIYQADHVTHDFKHWILTSYLSLSLSITHSLSRFKAALKSWHVMSIFY